MLQLQEQINSLRALLLQKDEQIEQLQRNLNMLYQLLLNSNKLEKPKKIFIPEGKEWKDKSSTEIFLDI